MGASTPRPVSNPKYYLQEPSLSPMVWAGNGSKKLGIEGQAVDEKTYLDLYEGRFNDTKLPRYMHKDRRGEFEVTVTFPKPASIMAMVGGDSRIKDVLETSIKAAMQHIEKRAYSRCPWERNENLIMTYVIHGSSRMHEPHLHGHIIIKNLTKASKGWKAIELRYAEWEKLGEVVRDSQMKGLRQLGYKVRREGKEYTIVGVPAEVKATFSRRHEDIKQREVDYEQKKGAALTSKAKLKLSVYDRPDKVILPLADLRKRWEGLLTGNQLDNLLNVVRKAKAAIGLDKHIGRMKIHAMNLISKPHAKERDNEREI